MENEQITDQFKGKSEEQMTEIANKLSTIPTPIFLGVGTTERERNLINKFNVLVEEANVDPNQPKFEIALLSVSMLESCYSLYFLSKLSEDELYKKEQADKKLERRRDLHTVIGKVVGFLKHYYKFETESALTHLKTGLRYTEWKETIQIACDKKMSNKEFVDLMHTFEEEGMLFVLNEDYTTPVHKRTYCLSQDSDEFQLEILTQQIQNEKNKVAQSNAIIQGLNSRIDAINKNAPAVVLETEMKPKKKRVYKKKVKPVIEVVNDDGELKQTTEHLNDIQNDDNNKGQGDRELESNR